jgi:hypothetical protein
MNKWGLAGLLFVSFAIAVTGVLLAAYIIVQQNYRVTLDDPQIQIAEDAALALQNGAVPAEIVPHGTPLVNLKDSLAPWVAVYDSGGTILESTGQLNNAPPKLPQGVFDTTHWNKFVIGHHLNPDYHLNGSPVLQDRISWQPESGVRQAVVITETPDKKYFVAAGRNMREVEQRIEHEGELIFVAWFGILGAVLACILIGVWASQKT